LISGCSWFKEKECFICNERTEVGLAIEAEKKCRIRELIVEKIDKNSLN
jgi:hypothetical protein